MKKFQKGLVSIVVPTYYSEKYMEKCLTCIVSQTYPNIEVIVVDGESTDGTREIIAAFEEKYDFVRCIVKKNEGVSASRNCGMAEAQGEYLQFVDSDDFLFPKATATLVQAMEDTQADVVTAGFLIMKTGEERQPQRAYFADADSFILSFGEYYHYKKNCINVPWNKMYRRECLCASFPEELSMGEDLMFNLDVFEKAKGIAFIPDLVYKYNNVNDQSLAYRYREDGFDIETRIQERVLSFVSAHYGACNKVVFHNYLFGVKAKITALVHKSGRTRRDCCREIDSWTRQYLLHLLACSDYDWGRKDRILLFMLRHHWKRCLYWYYRLMA